MTNRCTSKASLLDEKSKGHLESQEINVLEIMSIGGTFSRQEILAIYRGKYGDIEYTSISRCCTNLKDAGKIHEVGTRKCGVTNKTINELSINNCTHEKYKGEGYMLASNALKAMKKGDIVWRGMVVTECECGADISHAKRVPVKTFEQYQGANK